MKRLSRISTIWRKEFADTLRDKRTVATMVLLPLVAYPVLMLGSLSAFEMQVSRLQRDEYVVAVASEKVGQWLRSLIEADEEARKAARKAVAGDGTDGDGQLSAAARAGAMTEPPTYRIVVIDTVREAVETNAVNVGLLVVGETLPDAADDTSVEVALFVDSAEIRSQMAAAGLEGILERTAQRWVRQRLDSAGLPPAFICPLALKQFNVATPEKLGGSALGQIVPLILVIITITGAIYPAIDLTAGERERGTLETLMAAPVPTVDLIAGKFVVVASIGMLSAVLNLLSIGGTVYLAGIGDTLTQGHGFTIPLRTLPMVLIVLIPLSIMFSALLLAVCSFARSFKEAQNYVMPVMMAAIIPAMIGVLPGTELDGPMLILPVTNIVILTRELFKGIIDPGAVVWVTLSTCMYAGAAVAVAAKLFGQEAVLFSDASSIKTIFKRRFFRQRWRPTAAQAFLLMALVYSLNFFIQQSTLRSGVQPGSLEHLAALGITLAMLFVALPLAAAAYARVNITTGFSLGPPRPLTVVAALCFGAATWVLVLAWLPIQNRILPLPPELLELAPALEEQMRAVNIWTLVFFFGIVPAFCEEIFFRGYALNGLRGGLGRSGAVLVTAFAFAVAHYSAHRFVVTFALGVLLGLLVVRSGSIWPAMLAHALHNSLVVLVGRKEGLRWLLEKYGFVDVESTEVMPPVLWIAAAAGLVLLGIILCFLTRPPRTREPDAPPDEFPEAALTSEPAART